MECIYHDFVCEHCSHGFDPSDLRFSCHEKMSAQTLVAGFNIIMISALVFNLVDNNLGLFLLPFFSSDLPVLNYSMFQFLENTLQNTITEENLLRLRRLKIESLQAPTPKAISLWRNNILMGCFLVYGTHTGILDGGIKGAAFWLVSYIVSLIAKFLLGQWLGIVIFPGISKGFMTLSVLYVYFRFPYDVAFNALYGIGYRITYYLFSESAIFFFKVVTWLEISGAVLMYLFLPSGICLTGAICSVKKGHYCCVCEEFRRQRCRYCGYILNE